MANRFFTFSRYPSASCTFGMLTGAGAAAGGLLLAELDGGAGVEVDAGTAAGGGTTAAVEGAAGRDEEMAEEPGSGAVLPSVVGPRFGFLAGGG